ncbi:MAG: DEAD/DEAH box helicase family protein [Leptolyngbya sp. Prado105]|jgi:superfamily II DNA or RNA helicase|nr:DEAD/DEAH box helicase family protein [Leptolyngbya sp. Prado105]
MDILSELRSFGLNLEPREWQRQALDCYLREVPKNFLACVCPGAGKTIFAALVSHALLRLAIVRQIVIVVHSDHLRSQWIEEFAKLHLRLNTEIKRAGSDGYIEKDGFVLTYQQLASPGMAEMVHRVVQGRHRTLVILEECHHMAESRSWGDAVQIAMRQVWKRLLLSGTPFRHDDAPIPYVRYRDRIGQSDFTYGYDDALKAGIVAPIYFPSYGGLTRWRMGEQEFSAAFGTSLSETAAAQQLNTAISNASWIKTVLQDAHDRLLDLRSFHPEAGGLVIAKNQSHARWIAEILTEIAEVPPVLVISDIETSQAAIAQFRTSHDPWIVAVKMISEGVDIPRLRVGVFATNVRTELFFRQVVGRLIRVQDGLNDQSAYLYVPQHPILLRYAREIAKERRHVLLISPPAETQRMNGVAAQWLLPLSAEAIAGLTLLPGGEFSAQELEIAQQVRDRAKLSHLSLETVAQLLRAQHQLANKQFTTFNEGIKHCDQFTD